VQKAVDGAKTPRELSRLLSNWGTALVHSNFLRRAEDVLREAVSMDDKNELALEYLGRVLEERGWKNNNKALLVDAMHLYHRVIDLNPDNFYCQDRIGNYLTSIGNHERAVPYLEKAMNANLRYESVMNCADTLISQGQKNEAIKIMKSLLGSDDQTDEQLEHTLLYICDDANDLKNARLFAERILSRPETSENVIHQKAAQNILDELIDREFNSDIAQTHEPPLH
jgi:tetratricopeptide (TPR) repeat protein